MEVLFILFILIIIFMLFMICSCKVSSECSKKEAIEKFYNCRNREYYIILNIIELGSEE